VYWLAPAPTRRYVMAALLVVAALVWDLWPTPQVEHPVAAFDLPAGHQITQGDLEWVPVPEGFLPAVEPSGFLVVGLAAGEPLLSTHLVVGSPLPAGWWEVPVDLPAGVVAGRAVRVAVTTPGSDTASLVPGLVVRGGDAAGRGGAIGVAEHDAGRVAGAVAAGRVVVLVGR
jgi:hypothetical protein